MYAIASCKNAKVRAWRRLRRPDVARRSSQVYVEGLRAVLQALESSHRARALLVCPELARPKAVRLLERRVDGALPVYHLSREAFASLSDRDGPSGVAAIMELRVGRLLELGMGRDDVVVALWRVENPGNLGTIMRTADSFGTRAVALVDRCTNPYSPVAAKASMGALFHTPLVTCRDLSELRAWCDRRGAALVGTSARGAVQATGWEPRRPLVLLFGREGGGLSPEAVALCDYTVCIPMQGVNTSLNLATAVGILAYTARLQPAHLTNL
jgi:TrmH family RNA methyltransferase